MCDSIHNSQNNPFLTTAGSFRSRTEGEGKKMVHRQPKHHSSPNYKKTRSFSSDHRTSGGEMLSSHQPSLQVLKNGTHDKHCDQKILLGDLGMREDIVQYSVHVTLVLFSKGKHTFVVVTCKQQKELVLIHWVNFHSYLLFFYSLHLISSERKHPKNFLG